METEAEFLELPAHTAWVADAFDADAARELPDRGMKGRLMRHRWVPVGSWRAHLLLKCFAK